MNAIQACLAASAVGTFAWACLIGWVVVRV
jgi:hypothetical protein